MACNTNSCPCNCCPNLVKSTAVALSGTNLQITIPTMAITNGQKLCIALCQATPGTVTPNTTVTLISGSANINLINECGNYVYADQLRARKVLRVRVATDVPLAITCNTTRLCSTQHVFPTLNVATPATAATAAVASK